MRHLYDTDIDAIYDAEVGGVTIRVYITSGGVRVIDEESYAKHGDKPSVRAWMKEFCSHKGDPQALSSKR